MKSSIEISAGTIEYEDTGGDGPVIVLLHGLLMDATLWDDVIAQLPDEYRCVAPTLPMGGHRHAVKEGTDLSQRGIARIVSEFLAALDLKDVILVGNDTGGVAVQLLAVAGDPRVGRIVLVSCDAFDNFPPGLSGKTVVLTGKLPPALFGLFMQQLRLKPMRRLPISFGWLTKRGDAVTRRWLEPMLKHADIRRDAVRVLRAMSKERGLLQEAARDLPGFERPALVVWAQQDRVMPLDHGRRLAEILSEARLVEVPDSYTLVPLDNPGELARAIREFAES